MESFYAITLAFLEMTFIFVGLGLLHSQRKTIGGAAFYIGMGILFLFSQLISAAEVRVNIKDFEFYIGSTVLFLPYLSSLLLVYITAGTLAAQRVILGVIAGYGLLFYLISLSRLQCDWAGFAISQGIGSDILNFLLTGVRNSATGATLAQVFSLFLLPMVFQKLRNMRYRLFWCTLGALLITELADTFIYLSVTSLGRMNWWGLVYKFFVAKAVASVWMAVLLTGYLRKIETEFSTSEKSTLDVIFAFFGGYGRSKALEKDLREWEGRYRLVVQNASEMIMLLNLNGEIIDANSAALRILGKNSVKELQGVRFFDQIKRSGEKQLFELSSVDLHDNANIPVRFKVTCPTASNKLKELDIAISAIQQEGVMMLILIARDVTEEAQLAKEKEKLSEQLAHSQRLEAIGKLAGGIAHDFNNHIHAILGHLDVVNLVGKFKNDRVIQHLDKIGEISEKAGKLTGQLLGFARKGKYHEVELDMCDLVRKSVELFLPNSQKQIDLKLSLPDEPMMVKGDVVQLQQAFINLLINAKYAMDGFGTDLHISVGKASDCDEKLSPGECKAGKIDASRYVFIKIKDSGHGMSKETIQHIFEPFFTTKPTGKGTGMGLAMVYGTISNHGGWVQVKSKEGKGTTFYLFLPLLG